MAAVIWDPTFALIHFLDGKIDDLFPGLFASVSLLWLGHWPISKPITVIRVGMDKVMTYSWHLCFSPEVHGLGVTKTDIHDKYELSLLLPGVESSISGTAAAAAAAKSLQSCSTLCNPIDGSPSGSPVPGILQARVLEWVAISFSNAWKWKWTRSVVWTLRDPMDCSLLGSSIHGIFQARVPEWGAIAFSDIRHYLILSPTASYSFI